MSFNLDLDHIDRRRLVPGLILITLGVLGLLGSLGWLGGLGGLVGTLLFGAAAYYAYQQGQRTGALGWRAATYPLAGLAIAGIAPDPLGGAAFLLGLGLAFVLAYRDDAARWWAIIPAGALLSMALTALVDDAAGPSGSGGAVFLLGLAATFFALTRLPQHAQRWALYPAAALALLALLALTTGGAWVVPVVLIGAGTWMLLKPETARDLRARLARTVREATETQASGASAAKPGAAADESGVDDGTKPPSAPGPADESGVTGVDAANGVVETVPEADGDETAPPPRDDAEPR